MSRPVVAFKFVDENVGFDLVRYEIISRLFISEYEIWKQAKFSSSQHVTDKLLSIRKILISALPNYSFERLNIEEKAIVFKWTEQTCEGYFRRALKSKKKSVAFVQVQVICDRRSVLVSGPHLGPMTRFVLLSDTCTLHVEEHPSWREVGSVIYSYNLLSLSGPSPSELMTTVSFETPPARERESEREKI
jgi:hypothetical protein